MKSIYLYICSFALLVNISCNVGKQTYSSRKIYSNFLSKYVDSINNITSETIEPPRFLFDSCFDDKPAYWSDLHSPISLRKQIIDKIVNKSAVEFLLKKYKKELSAKCSMKIDSVYYSAPIPLIDKSFYDLLSKRLQELK